MIDNALAAFAHSSTTHTGDEHAMTANEQQLDQRLEALLAEDPEQHRMASRAVFGAVAWIRVYPKTRKSLTRECGPSSHPVLPRPGAMAAD